MANEPEHLLVQTSNNEKIKPKYTYSSIWAYMYPRRYCSSFYKCLGKKLGVTMKKSTHCFEVSKK